MICGFGRKCPMVSPRITLPLVLVVAVIGAVLVPHQPAHAQAGAPLLNSGSNPFSAMARWWMIPEGQTWTPTAGIGLDRQGHVWVGCADCAAGPDAPIQEFDKSGKRLRSFGAGMFVAPHGLFVDRDDNIWVTD